MTWYAFGCRSLTESALETVLAKRGVEAFVPREMKLVRSRGSRRKTARVPVPMLPGYIFVKDPCWSVLNLTAIRSVKGFNGEPARISDSVMDTWRRRLGTTTTAPVFRVGSRVRVADGLMFGYSGTVEAITERKARIVFSQLGVGDVPLEHLEAA